MRRDILFKPLLVLAAIVAGTAAWGGDVLLLPIATAFPVLWSLAPTRLIAAIVASSYFLAASRGLPQGVANYYATDFLPGVMLWFCACASFVSVHAFAWTPHSSRRPVRYLAAMIAMAVPPFGITGWAHPLTAAGVLYPAWGWWGLLVMTAGLAGLVTRLWPAVAISLAGFWLWSAASWTEPALPDGWRGVDLELHQSLGRDGSLSRHRDLIATVRGASPHVKTVVVLPEAALGFWTPTTERTWIAGLQGTNVTVVAGALVADPGGYDNVLVEVSAAGGKVLYRERMPVPGSMWQPWRSWSGARDSAQAYFFANPVVTVSANRVAPLICYEQLLVWPILQSMLNDPDLIVAVGNGWWTGGTSIVAIQRANAIAWAKLFSKPLVFSFNI